MASAKKVNKPCEDCGVLLVNVVPTRKYCYSCARKRQRANAKQYRTVKDKKCDGVLRGTPIQNPNAKYCKGCKYWWGAYDGYEMCNYIFCKGHRRPCPPGKDCTEKVIDKKKRSRKFAID